MVRRQSCGRGTFEPHTRLRSRIVPRAKVNEMTTATETFKKTATANARYAADAAEDAAGNVSEFANDVTRTAGKQF